MLDWIIRCIRLTTEIFNDSNVNTQSPFLNSVLEETLISVLFTFIGQIISI